MPSRFTGGGARLVIGLVEFEQRASRNGVFKGVRASVALAIDMVLSPGIGWLVTHEKPGTGLEPGCPPGTPSDDPAVLGARVHEYLRQCEWQLGNVLLVAAAAAGDCRVPCA